AGAAAPAAGQNNIWGFFMKTPAQKVQCQQNMAMCRAQFCNSRIGQFVNNMLLPAGAITGGMLGPICPGPLAANPADLQKPATSPQGAAARIKAEEAQAKEKIAAIEFLATVDCRYYPEAEAALIVGLRAEKNECVRLAAAKALATGCCCTARILKALLIAVSCSTEDKFPAERSELVKAYAYVALERCLRRCVEAEPEPSPEPPAAAKQAVYETLTPFGPLADYTTQILMVSYFPPGGGDSSERVYESARRTLAKGLKLSPQTIAWLSGPRTVMDAVAPGYEPPRPGSLLEKMDLRGAMAAPKWITTLPKSAPQPEALGASPAGASTAPEWLKPVAVGAALPTQPDPVADPKPTPLAGRGNLLNIFQDSRRR
ncbi:MAG: hypothetical protein JWO38_4474, partial [Gemmataceae bacterium]|nr:hypothetical protein [Gemmataceae bacterium]